MNNRITGERAMMKFLRAMMHAKVAELMAETDINKAASIAEELKYLNEQYDIYCKNRNDRLKIFVDAVLRVMGFIGNAVLLGVSIEFERDDSFTLPWAKTLLNRFLPRA